MNEKRIQRYFNLAKKASEYSDYVDRYKMGAVAIYKNIYLAYGFNHCKTSPSLVEYTKYRGFKVQPFFHAESHCLNKIKDLDIDFSKVSIFVYREHKNGITALAKPCPSCNKLIKDLRIHNVYYTTNDGWAYEKYL